MARKSGTRAALRIASRATTKRARGGGVFMTDVMQGAGAYLASRPESRCVEPPSGAGAILGLISSSPLNGVRVETRAARLCVLTRRRESRWTGGYLGNSRQAHVQSLHHARERFLATPSEDLRPARRRRSDPRLERPATPVVGMERNPAPFFAELRAPAL